MDRLDRVIPIQEIDDFESIAVDLNDLLKRADNTDIATEFPASFKRYTGRRRRVMRELAKAKGLYRPGIREQVIIFAGKAAVGIGAVSTEIDGPLSVDPSWPNISGYICNPYRGQGLGRLSIVTRMGLVREHFGNHAWTYVKEGNLPSEHLVTSVGFQQIEPGEGEWAGYNVYLFDGSRSG